MPIQQLIDDLLRGNLLLAAVVAVSALLLLIVQIFTTLVFVRVLFFIWRALGFLESSVHELSTKQRGLWGAGSQKALDDFHQSQSARWRAAALGIYVLWLMTPFVAALFMLGQQAAWVLLIAEVVILVLVGIAIIFS